MTHKTQERTFIPFLAFILLFFGFASPALSAPATEPWTQYRVVSGDTLDSIARAHGISEKNLRFANAVHKGGDLEPGATLLIPKTDDDACAVLTEVLARKKGTVPDSAGRRQEIRLPGPKEQPRSTAMVVSRIMTWPVKGTVSSPFGVRRGGRSRRGHFHDGIDIPAPRGTSIVAALDGKVVSAASQRGYGKTVTIDHGNGFVTRYCHCLGFSVKVGGHVRRGQKIATVGRTGRATCNHVHFSVLRHGRVVDPAPYLHSTQF
jgi:murein DD-endopeptidase MepM/ murein hydrolase activator NlpD